MKTRLLKKVRKRYAIYEVTNVPIKSAQIYLNGYMEFGLPFFLVYDKKGSYSATIHKTKFDALRKLKALIREHYAPKVKDGDLEIEKVWY